jgi:hypothetical protein
VTVKLRLAQKIGNTPRAGRPVRRVTMVRAWRRTKHWRLMKQWPEWRRHGGRRPLKYCPTYECGWTDLIKAGRCKMCGKLWKPNFAAYEARMRAERELLKAEYRTT